MIGSLPSIFWRLARCNEVQMELKTKKQGIRDRMKCQVRYRAFILSLLLPVAAPYLSIAHIRVFNKACSDRYLLTTTLANLQETGELPACGERRLYHFLVMRRLLRRRLLFIYKNDNQNSEHKDTQMSFSRYTIS